MTEPEADGAIIAGVQRMLATDHASQQLGIRVLSAGGDQAVAQMEVRADMANGHSIAHGGLIFALADTAFICACATNSRVAVTSSASIIYISPARVGDVLTATATVRNRFGRAVHCDVTVTSGSGVVAEFRGSAIQVTST
ncbi:MAG TPA: hotdog fold thioesterase [Microbacterium sp.]|uniref:hotdog fold thioesterase n=1 Tax=Microbacterium sp. TaxID=51671 RepID=UPI002B8412D3|nr:hotdog fold thioesterase [Microbacterium sp.]HWI31809.1 hotdog fold thioesterase [Microbacterium sp.]